MLLLLEVPRLVSSALLDFAPGPIRRALKTAVPREYRLRLRLWRRARRPGARRAEREAEVFLLSYPKTGRTWLRVLLNRVLASHAGLSDVADVDYLANDITFGSEAGIPRIRISHDDEPQWKTPRRLERSKRRYRDKKVIFLVRDPRDTLVSHYMQKSKRELVSASLPEFMRFRKGSLETILAYFNVWARRRDVPRGFHLVRYEDLRRDTPGELRRLLDFLGLPDVSEEHVREAVAFASFDHMRKMERQGTLGSDRLKPTDAKDAESFKTRRGKVGGYRDYLSEAEVAWMNQRIAEVLDPSFGYAEPAASPRRAA